MRDYLTLGSVPASENCAPVGSKNYTELARKECARYRDLLKIVYPAGTFSVQSFPHDFGNYYEVVASFDVSKEGPEYDEERQAAFDAESCEYTTWDELEAAANASFVR
jgi:hypothetical protein